VPVTTRALVQRINRKLARDEKQLRAYRGGRWETTLGRYYVVDVNRNAIVDTDVNLETLARELDALRAWEALMEEEAAAEDEGR
jgi:hypothetical protein